MRVRPARRPWIALLCWLLLGLSHMLSSAWSQTTVQPALTFQVAPGDALFIGDAVQLRAHWNRPRQPSWRVMFQQQQGNDWITLRATDGLGNDIREANRPPVDYACDQDDCRLAVNPSVSTATTLQFRLVVVDLATGQRREGTTILSVTWSPRPPRGSQQLVLRLTTAGASCEVMWTIGGPGTQPDRQDCRSRIDGSAVPGSAQVTLAGDGSAPAVETVANWTGFDGLPWGWTVTVSFATGQGSGSRTCLGLDGSCTMAIPARPATIGQGIGREYIAAQIGWDQASGPEPTGRGPNPVVGPPGGIAFGGLSVEQGIDYRR